MNTSAHYVYFRSPPFALNGSSLSTASLLITANPSPNVDTAHGNLQPHLLCAFKLFVNGVPAAVGPGRPSPSSFTPVTALDIAPLLRAAPALNILAIACYFTNGFGGQTDAAAQPRLQLELSCRDASGGEVCRLATAPGGAWLTHSADAYHHPEGDSTRKSPWYHSPNEDLQAPLRPLGWQDPAFAPSPPGAWLPAALQPPWPPSSTLYTERSPPPAMLHRPACSVEALGGGAGQVLDFGQTLNGGVNLSFIGPPGAWGAGAARVLILLGEERHAGNGSVVVPSRSSVNYTALWTLDAAGSPNNLHLSAHEFIQFRYAQVVGSPVALTPDTAGAWVLEHPAAASNPFATPPCAANLAYTSPAPPGPAGPPPPPAGAATYASFTSSLAALDAVFNFTAFTAIVAGGLDVNVDSQTRQRDMCNVDAAITAAEQYAVFPGGDYALQRRTTRLAFENSSGAFSTNFEFKASSTLMACMDALESGSSELVEALWGGEGDDDEGVNSASDPLHYVSVQFLSGLRWFNRSGSGLLHIPPETPRDPSRNCGGAGGGGLPGLGCDPLIDWPVGTRGGYIVTAEDAIRNGIAGAAIAALAQVAALLGRSAQAAHYAAVHAGIRSAMLALLLRRDGNASEAYFVDGPTPLNASAGSHAAVHSTLYAVAGAGVADVPLGGNSSSSSSSSSSGGGDSESAALACELSAYLARVDTGGASCMTARWHLEALYRLGIQCGAAADTALLLLSRGTYPSWAFMQSPSGGNATTTLEAWAPDDKWNTDFSHPWCASPAFVIPRFLAGARPLGLGWRRFLVAPQPGNLTRLALVAPTPLGQPLRMALQQSGGSGATGEVALSLCVPPGSAAQVCLPPLHASLRVAPAPAHALAFAAPAVAAQDVLVVDGVQVEAVAWGRMLCAAEDIGAGVHEVKRVAGSSVG